MRTPTLAVQVRLPLVRIEHVFAFQIWYCELCVKADEGEAKSIIFILFLSSFFSVKSFLKICANHFSHLTFVFLKFQAFFVIIFNNWGKTVIRLFFLSVSTISTVKYCRKLAIFKFLFLFHFVRISYSLSSHLLPAQSLSLIDLHNGVKKYSRVICEVLSERRINSLKFA